jgi:phosphoglycolate phosphatase
VPLKCHLRDKAAESDVSQNPVERGRAADLVLFDLDGTLVDSAPDIAQAVAVTLEEAGIVPPPLESVKRMVGDGARALIHRALDASGMARDEDALLARFLVHYGAGLCIQSRPYHGVPELLDRIRASGAVTAVVTNKPGELARRLLRLVGMAAGWMAVVGDGDGFARKPDPAAARALIARAGVIPGRTAMVGDGLPDVTMAQAAGVRPLAVGWGYVPPERLRAAGAVTVASTAADLAAALGLPAGPG